MHLNNIFPKLMCTNDYKYAAAKEKVYQMATSSMQQQKGQSCDNFFFYF